jgi:carboxyl-terminal processing protease
VAPVILASKTNGANLFLEEMRNRSQSRISEDPEFTYVNEDMRRLRERIEKNSISTNEELRRQEIADEKARKESRKVERLARGPIINAKVWQVTLDDVKNNREDLEVVAYERNRDKKYDDEDSDETEDGKKADQKTPEPDPIRNEAVRIISDLIDFSGLGKTASTTKADVAPVESKP